MKMFVKFLMLVSVLSCVALACTPPGEDNGDIVNNKNVKEAIAERIKNGGTIKDALPPTSVMVVGVFVPISAIVGFFIVAFYLSKMHFKKVNLMIEKGIYQPKAFNIRWDLIFLFIGIISAFSGIGVSLYSIGNYGVIKWAILSGSIPLFVGIGFVLLAFLFRKFKNQ